jgi:hypothetical protein
MIIKIDTHKSDLIKSKEKKILCKVAQKKYILISEKKYYLMWKRSKN